MTDRHNWPLALSYAATQFGDETLAVYRNAGIHYMEFSGGNLSAFEETEYVKNARAIYEKAKSYDVTISSVHLPFSPFSLLDPAFADPAKRDKVVEIQSELLRAAADSGVEIAVIHPSGEPYEESEREDRLQCAIDVIGRLNKIAKEAGITLALENLPRTCLCRNSADMLRFLHDIPDLHVCFDTNHNLAEPNVDFIRAVGSRIVTLHVSDYDFVDEKHWFPMEGLNPWNDMFAVLEEVGYSGRFTYEVGFKDGKTIADVAENFARLMQ